MPADFADIRVSSERRDMIQARTFVAINTTVLCPSPNMREFRAFRAMAFANPQRKRMEGTTASG